MAIVTANGDSPLHDALAKEVAETLTFAYPNHGWFVEVKGGVLVIKHLEASGARGLIGMLRKLDALSHDAMARKKDVIRAGGELLERAGLARGARTDDPVLTFELDDKKMEKYWHAPGKILH